MVEKLTVIFFIILCLLLGFYLILAPWDALFGPWGTIICLPSLADRSGAPVSSEWSPLTGFAVE